MRHFATSAFPISKDDVGGLSSVFCAEGSDDIEINLLTPNLPFDTLKVPGIKVIPVDIPVEDNNEIWTYWFGSGLCQLQFPEAYTKGSVRNEIISKMFESDINRESIYEIGSHKRLLEYIDLHCPPESVFRTFTNRFNSTIESIPSGSIMNWQSFFFEQGINSYANSLRDRNIYQTFHLHESMPDNLYKSKWGKKLLTALTLVDSVYMHCDLFIDRTKSQMQKLGLKIPDIQRFDLGVDKKLIKTSLEKINHLNFKEAIHNFKELKLEIKKFITQVFNSYETIPHRFICVDRIDPVKGVDVIYDSIFNFLNEEKKNGIEIDKQYHFFFIQNDNIRNDQLSPTNLNHQYLKICKEKLTILKNTFPECVFFSPQIGGKDRVIIPALMKACNGLSGGTVEGLSLAVMEEAYTNKGNNTGVICGSNAGFAIRLKEQGKDKLILTPKPGSVLEFTEAIQDLVQQQKHEAQKLREKSQELHKVIDMRTDSVIVGK